uniref:Ig-like domain-containing protein n=1 Tax=Peromyscus maniculatus bairdii TaxID=230844 RepID=A0A8C8W130_PERMB
MRSNPISSTPPGPLHQLLTPDIFLSSLLVSLLTYWNSPITALFVTVEAIPPIVAVGNSVLLAVHDMPLDYGLFSWYKEVNSGKQFIASCTPRPNSIALEAEFRDKVEMYRNVSLLIRNVSKDEGGRYRAKLTDLKLDNQAFARISSNTQGNHLSVVSTTPLPKTNITTNNSNPMEGEDSVALMCEPETQNTAYLWRINDQSLSEESRLKLLEDNRTLILLSVSKDSGNYQCEVSNPLGSKISDPFQLDVIDPVTPPSIQVTNTTVKDMISVFLTCLSKDTGISIHWFFKGQRVEITDRMKLSQNNSTLQIVSVRIEDSGDYQCEVSNQVSSKRSDPIQLDIIVSLSTECRIGQRSSFLGSLPWVMSSSLVLFCFISSIHL